MVEHEGLRDIFLGDTSGRAQHQTELSPSSFMRAIGSKVFALVMFDSYEFTIVGYDKHLNKYQLEWPAGGTFWVSSENVFDNP